MRVLSRLFRRLFLDGLAALHAAGRLAFLGDLAPLGEKSAFDAALAPLRRSEWVVYAKRPFAGPQAVLAYLARYTHRVAISNSRLIALNEKGVAFNWKDYRVEGRDRFKTMTLAAHEFIRRFLLHVLPSGFHRIRHYGLIAGAVRADNIERARQLLAAPEASPERSRNEADSEAEDSFACASLPVLRRPDDHRRDLRRRAPRAIAIPEPDQDRQLMTVAPHPAVHRRSPPPPAARRNTSATPARGRQPSCARDQRLAPAHRRHRKRPTPPLPTKTPSAPGRRRLARQPSAILKSP